MRCSAALKCRSCYEDDNKRALFVSADIFGFGPEMVQLIRQFASIWGIEAEAVTLNARIRIMASAPSLMWLRVGSI